MISGMAESFSHWGMATVSSFMLIALAEIGDKSQVVCMALAARYRPLAVLLGATAAFAVLNLAAIAVGASLHVGLPPAVVQAGVALLFAGFAVHAFRSNAENLVQHIEKREHSSVFAATFLLTVASEFGDKTQIAVAGLGGTLHPAGVWLGATLALTGTSLIGVLAGGTILKRLPLRVLHRLSGCIFAGLAALLLGRIVLS